MSPRRLHRAIVFAAALAIAFAIIGCGGSELPLTTMAPKSDFANWILGVYLEVIGWDTIVLIIVSVALGLALFRFSTRAHGRREQWVAQWVAQRHAGSSASFSAIRSWKLLRRSASSMSVTAWLSG